MFSVCFSVLMFEAKSSLDFSEAKLNKLLARASKEEIEPSETKVNNAKTALSDAYKNLDDALALSSENIKSAYQDALSVLEDAYLKIYNAYAVVDSIQETYFYSNDQQGVKVMIAGGMGGRAIQFFQQFGIEPITGATGTVSEALDLYLSGRLKGFSTCND